MPSILLIHIQGRSEWSGRFVIRNPPNMKYRIRALARTQPKAANGPSQDSGIIRIQGIANGRSNIPDSPESAGFFDATKNIQAKMAMARRRNNPAAAKPPGESLNTGLNILPLKLWGTLAPFIPPN